MRARGRRGDYPSPLRAGTQSRRGRREGEGSLGVGKPSHTGSKDGENLNSIKNCFVLFLKKLLGKGKSRLRIYERQPLKLWNDPERQWGWRDGSEVKTFWRCKFEGSKGR